MMLDNIREVFYELFVKDREKTNSMLHFSSVRSASLSSPAKVYCLRHVNMVTSIFGAYYEGTMWDDIYV